MKFLQIAPLFLISCVSPKTVRMIDNDMSPENAVHQIEIEKTKGDTHVSVGRFSGSYGQNYSRVSYEQYCKKDWLLNNWGSPDSYYHKNGTDYLSYNVQPGSLPLIFGYKNNKLVYAEINAGEKEWMHGKDPYILAK